MMCKNHYWFFFDLYKNLKTKNLSCDTRSEFDLAYQSVRSSETYLKHLFRDMIDCNVTQKSHFEFFSFSKAFFETLELVSYSSLIRDLTVSFQWSHVHLIFGSKIQFQRALYNLFSNALDAMAGQGILWFQTNEKQNIFYLEVGNSGSQIPEPLRKNLFRPFVTLSKPYGNGLGR